MPGQQPQRFLRTDPPAKAPVLATLWHQDAVRDCGFDEETWLAPEEVRELAALAHEKRRREWIAARAAMKDLVVRSGLAEAPGEVIIRKDSRGAPRVVVWSAATLRYAEVACSISHCAPYVFCAAIPVRGARVGADVERRTWRLGRVGRKYVSPADSMLEKDDQSGDETVLWSFKEALSKLLGTGWACGFKSIVCTETAPGVCRLEAPDATAYDGSYSWFGQYALCLVWSVPDASGDAAPMPPKHKRRGVLEAFRKRRALRRRHAALLREKAELAASVIAPDATAAEVAP